ncbi:ester cyclase [Amycolatopsis sp.]|jgi:steroid delta-isomerase-like uncharacterized protein|uniref:ester cyclase n=1 Tax=Amycolatopsis sp. TaxID=37632 RepID=UPI002DFEEE4A|nr:ester cyclase [Amycolatopsis sp.]
MTRTPEEDAAVAVVRRNVEEVQGTGDFAVFEEIFADDFVDHTQQPGMPADKASVRHLYGALREAFPDLTPEIRWQSAEGGLVTTFKILRGTHRGDFFGLPATGRTMAMAGIDAMSVVDGKITGHWGFADMNAVLQQLGGAPEEDPSV